MQHIRSNHSAHRPSIVCFGYLLLFASLFASHACSAAAPSTGKPNIVIIVADDLGWADVGFRGSPIQTPNLDQMAATGLELSRFYTTPSCSPTRAALMTGRNPFRLGIAYATIMPWSNNGVAPEERFLPEAFRDAGYQTAMFGKWHLGHAQETYHPNQRGFDHFYGHLHTEVGFYPPFANQRGKDFQRNGQSIDEEGYETFLLIDEAKKWLSSRDEEKPFLIYLPFLAPHTPLDAPEEYQALYKDLEDTRGASRSPVDRISAMAKRSGQRPSQRPMYAAVVTAMDHAIGQLLETLEEKALSDNTIVLFLSDNGGQTIFGAGGADNAPLRGSKGEVFEGGIRTVALMQWLGKLPEGKKFEATMSAMDVFPTLAAAAGIDTGASKKLDGINMWPALAESQPVERTEPLFFAQESPTFGSFKHTLIDGNWKLIQLVDQDLNKTNVQHMLFNTIEDPNETTDLGAQQPKRVAAMSAKINEWRSRYIVSGTRANLVPPPGWRAPLDWADYAVKTSELQDKAAPGMLKGGSKQLMQRQLGERGSLIYE